MAKLHGRAFHGRWPNHVVGAFHGRWPNHRVAHFTGDAESRGRAFHRRCQITGPSRISQGRAKSQGRRSFHRVARNHRVVAHFTGDAKSQGRAFHMRCQITGPSRISQGRAKSQGRRSFHRVARNHRVVAHFTGDAKSQGRAFHRRWPNHRVAHFTGDAKSQKRAFHELPVFTHFSSLFHFFSFGFENLFCKPFFFVGPVFRVNLWDTRHRHKQTNCSL